MSINVNAVWWIPNILQCLVFTSVPGRNWAWLLEAGLGSPYWRPLPEDRGFHCAVRLGLGTVPFGSLNSLSVQSP